MNTATEVIEEGAASREDIGQYEINSYRQLSTRTTSHLPKRVSTVQVPSSVCLLLLVAVIIEQLWRPF